MLGLISGNGISVCFSLKSYLFTKFNTKFNIKSIAGTRRWHRIKANKGPGELHSHSAIEAFNSMFIFGGERNGNLLRELWRFHFSKYIEFYLFIQNSNLVISDTEHWERINAEGVIPNCRCKHIALANPFLEMASEAEETNNKILRLSSNSNCITSSKNQSKAMASAPVKSISMCFGQPTDTPLHENGKPLKQFKFKVHPMPGLCSGRSATISDEDEDVENEENGKEFIHSAQVTMR